MITLLIDTSLSDVSIAILKDGQVSSQITQSIPNEHSVYTVSFIDKALKESKIKPQDIQQIMVVTGPGSFTGLRIGLTIAKVYAYLLNIELICLSSLKIRALSIQHKFCLSLIDAHHDNYYLGLYDSKNQEVIPEQFASKEKVLELIKQYHPTIVSDNPLQFTKESTLTPALNIESIAQYYNNKQTINPHFVVPNYLKLPQVLEDKK